MGCCLVEVESRITTMANLATTITSMKARLQSSLSRVELLPFNILRIVRNSSKRVDVLSPDSFIAEVDEMSKWGRDLVSGVEL